MSKCGIDVVIVPDFEGILSNYFELSTLFFLGSWIEHNSPDSSSTLHIASIGNPPASVQWLSAKAQASVSIHKPFLNGRTLNKIRGFDVSRRSDHLLLLDSDVLLLSNIEKVAALVERNAIGVSVANDAHLSIRQWKLLYSALNITPPDERISVLNSELNINIHNNINFMEYSSTFPYFNGGVISVPWNFCLGEEWRKAIEEINQIINSGFFENDAVEQKVFNSNQHSLAVAIERLRRKGRGFKFLPDSLHMRWQHLYLNSVNNSEFLIFHAIGAFKDKDIVNKHHVIKQYISSYNKEILDNFSTAMKSEMDDLDNILSKIFLWTKIISPMQKYYFLRSFINKIYKKHVRASLTHNNIYTNELYQ